MTKLIAEFCQNHNGDMNILERMVEEASSAGATHGKMQTIYSNTLSFRPQFEQEVYDSEGNLQSIKRPYINEYERLKKLEVSQENTIKFISLCKNNGLIPLTTCFSRSNIKDIYNAGFKVIKVASYDCASYQMIRELKVLFDELIVSTGATFDDEVKKTASILKGSDFSFLHCVTIYPTPLNKMNLSRMKWLKSFTPNVGFSDHSLVSRDNVIASLGAMALGANIVERHFTILPQNETKDGPVSITPKEMKQLYEFAKLEAEERVEKMNIDFPQWEKMLGDSNRKLSTEELLNRSYYRGRFASQRSNTSDKSNMIFNWEETSI